MPRDKGVVCAGFPHRHIANSVWDVFGPGINKRMFDLTEGLIRRGYSDIDIR